MPLLLGDSATMTSIWYSEEEVTKGRILGLDVLATLGVNRLAEK